MLEFEINGAMYAFNFGFGFIKEIDKQQIVKLDNGASQNIGFQMAVAQMIDGYLDSLVDILFYANSGQNPRLTRQVLEGWLEDSATDVDSVLQQVIDFLSSANCTKKRMENIMKSIEDVKNK